MSSIKVDSSEIDTRDGYNEMHTTYEVTLNVQRTCKKDKHVQAVGGAAIHSLSHSPLAK